MSQRLLWLRQVVCFSVFVLSASIGVGSVFAKDVAAPRQFQIAVGTNPAILVDIRPSTAAELADSFGGAEELRFSLLGSTAAPWGFTNELGLRFSSTTLVSGLIPGKAAVWVTYEYTDDLATPRCWITRGILLMENWGAVQNIWNTEVERICRGGKLRREVSFSRGKTFRNYTPTITVKNSEYQGENNEEGDCIETPEKTTVSRYTFDSSVQIFLPSEAISVYDYAPVFSNGALVSNVVKDFDPMMDFLKITLELTPYQAQHLKKISSEILKQQEALKKQPHTYDRLHQVYIYGQTGREIQKLLLALQSDFEATFTKTQRDRLVDLIDARETYTLLLTTHEKVKEFAERIDHEATVLGQKSGLNAKQIEQLSSIINRYYDDMGHDLKDLIFFTMDFDHNYGKPNVINLPDKLHELIEDSQEAKQRTQNDLDSFLTEDQSKVVRDWLNWSTSGDKVSS